MPERDRAGHERAANPRRVPRGDPVRRRAARRGHRGRGGRRAGRCAEPRRRPGDGHRAGLRRRGRRRPPRRVRPDPAGLRARPGAGGGLRLLRRPSGRPGHGLGVPEPHAPSRPPGGRRSRLDVLGGPRRRAARTCFEASGGFDAERYLVPSIEDIELGTRLAAAGCKIELDPLLQGTHLKAWSLRGMVETDFWARGVPWVELLLRQRSGSSTLNLGLAAPPERARRARGRGRAPAWAAAADARRARRARGAQPVVLRAARTSPRSCAGRDRRLAPRAPPRRRRAVGPGRDRRAPPSPRRLSGWRSSASRRDACGRRRPRTGRGATSPAAGASETLPVNVYLVHHPQGLCLFDAGQTARAARAGLPPALASVPAAGALRGLARGRDRPPARGPRHRCRVGSVGRALAPPHGSRGRGRRVSGRRGDRVARRVGACPGAVRTASRLRAAALAARRSRCSST